MEKILNILNNIYYYILGYTNKYAIYKLGITNNRL